MTGVRKLGQLTGHDGSIYAITGGFEENQILTGGADRVLASWDVQTMKSNPFAIRLDHSFYASLYVDPFQYMFIGNSSGGIHVIDLNERKEIRHFQLHKAGIYDFKYDPVHQMLYVASGDGSLSVWDVKNLSLIKHLQLDNSKLRKLLLIESESLIFAASVSGEIFVLNLEDLKPVSRIKAHDSVYSLEHHRDKKLLISGGKDAYLRFWSLTDNFKLIREIPAHNFAIYDIKRCDNFYATASRDKSIKLWDPRSFDLLEKLAIPGHQAHKNSVNALLWLEKQKILCSVSDDRSIILWGF
jgi:WD40 repeat protein